MASPAAVPETKAIDAVCARQHAAMLGIGTAVPANWLAQEEYVDWFFRVTKSDHLISLSYLG
uniref:Chalcone/stilbene synthase N-terminal domain-containing protein n=1 Tax=Leersia perrieri TaxID=77586 RepID=A0A0D9XSN1_9ORYZ